MKLIQINRHPRLKSSHSFILALSVASILLILFCFFCISFGFLSCVVAVLLPYAISATFGLILYLFLAPLHEAGHFYTSLYYIKKYNIPAKVYIKHSQTISSDWETFGDNKAVIILKNGSRTKIGYCIIMFLMMLPTGHIKSCMIFLFVVIFEYSLNCTPIKYGNDNYLIQNIEMFYREKDYVDKHKTSLDRHNKIRIIVWGIWWQIIIVILSVVILFFSYKMQFEIIDDLKNFILDYCYRK